MKKHETLPSSAELHHIVSQTPTVEDGEAVKRISREDAIAMGHAGLENHRFIDPKDAGRGSPAQVKKQLEYLVPLKLRLNAYPDDAAELRRILNYHKSGKMHI